MIGKQGLDLDHTVVMHGLVNLYGKRSFRQDNERIDKLIQQAERNYNGLVVQHLYQPLCRSEKNCCAFNKHFSKPGRQTYALAPNHLMRLDWLLKISFQAKHNCGSVFPESPSGRPSTHKLEVNQTLTSVVTQMQ
ncbi:hypothetical protein AVEN_194379-1 [Araneus ventricosus]|uniref:Uncharacterized protein n=1 Tax=Araneus ventricosus TaxID=182803 RepID=A0A4Y2A5I5_ARAVE|nr:hypothetical protein AVEN_194379-1 [Araneus ventricosus]